MVDASGRRAAANSRRSIERTARRGAIVLGLGIALLPVLTTSAAFQDMSTLLEGARSEARWQAYFVPAPASSVAAATLAFAGKPDDGRLPQNAALRNAEGKQYTVAPSIKAATSPDEDRVARAGKTGRVLSSVSAVSAPPKAFSAGSILERQSLLSVPKSTADTVAMAFAKQRGSVEKAIQVAMNFAPAQTPDRPAPLGDAVMMASLKPSVGAASALGYAPTEVSPGERTASLFEKILKQQQQPDEFIPPLGAGDHSWAATPLPVTAFSDEEQACLARGIYFEARGESVMGQAAVGQVILNRVRNPAYPKTICGVVYQNKNWTNRCQFSFACDRIKDRVLEGEAWESARRIAGQVTRGEIWINEVGSATHYHANYVKPRWAKAMERVDKIGRHIFYRTFGGGWN
ncbi:cell wall hydrolase [Mangrovicella endophytica]|uniref:cell wall hydrolase n=1 Tax=Mangrovicella endophytica TaxID=2066697 RepID=UPI000C9DEB2B|nr:cell wall hydrolase [Mangrovicella endophytica]